MTEDFQKSYIELPKLKSSIINIKNSVEIFGQITLKESVNYHIYQKKLTII